MKSNDPKNLKSVKKAVSKWCMTCLCLLKFSYWASLGTQLDTGHIFTWVPCWLSQDGTTCCVHNLHCHCYGIVVIYLLKSCHLLIRVCGHSTGAVQSYQKCKTKPDYLPRESHMLTVITETLQIEENGQLRTIIKSQLMICRWQTADMNKKSAANRTTVGDPHRIERI